LSWILSTKLIKMRFIDPVMDDTVRLFFSSVDKIKVLDEVLVR